VLLLRGRTNCHDRGSSTRPHLLSESRIASFPACDQCNAVSRTSERIIGVLVHGHADDEDRNAYKRNLESVRREFPQEIKALLTTRIEQRKILKSAGLSLPAGLALDDVPIVTMRREFWDPHLEMLARKLLLAVHYQCFGSSLSRSGGLWYYIHTNFNFAADQYPKEVLETAKRFATPIRNKRYLNDQFLIRWTVVENSSTGMFIMQLQKRLVITGFTTEEPDRFPDQEDILTPFGPWGPP
jgi:hypothetical protein